MKKPFVLNHVSLPPRRSIPNGLSEHLNCDNALAHDVGRPLFKNGIQVAAITTREGYHCLNDEDFIIHPNTHHTLTLLLQGELTVTQGDHVTVLNPGELAYTPPDLPFAYKGKKGQVSWWLYFKIADEPFWEPLRQNGPFIRPYDSADLMYLLVRRLLDAHRKRDLAGLAVARGDANMLVTVLSRLRKIQKRAEAITEKLQQLVSSIASEPANAWSLQTMAQIMGVSERNLFRLFRKEYGCSPMEMVIRQRLNKAIQLLADNQDPIATIAARCGYQSVYSFSRLFHKRVGFPPAQYRKRLQGNR